MTVMGILIVILLFSLFSNLPFFLCFFCFFFWGGGGGGGSEIIPMGKLSGPGDLENSKASSPTRVKPKDEQPAKGLGFRVGGLGLGLRA